MVVSDREMLRRYGFFYPEPTWYWRVTVKYLAAVLQGGGKEAEKWRCG